MKKVFTWIVYSSANAEKYSRTLKAALVAIAPTLIVLISYFFGIEVSPDSMTVAIGQVVEAVAGILSAIYLIAKVSNTIADMAKK